MVERDLIPISALQHWCYCPRQCALIHVEQVFADFSDTPLATASIGQVHRATLTDGRAVVVKIQYPGVAEAIRADLANGELIVSGELSAMESVPTRAIA